MPFIQNCSVGEPSEPSPSERIREAMDEVGQSSGRVEHLESWPELGALRLLPKLKLRLTTKSPTFSEMRRPLLQAGASAESINSLKKLFDAEDAVRFGSLPSCLSGKRVPLKNSSPNSKLNCALTVPGIVAGYVPRARHDYHPRDRVLTGKDKP